MSWSQPCELSVLLTELLGAIGYRTGKVGAIALVAPAMGDGILAIGQVRVSPTARAPRTR